MFSPHLDTRYGSEIQDIIANPPAANLYRHLKAELIHRLSLSQDQKVRQLLQCEKLGDHKSSQFPCHTHTLAGNTQIYDHFLQTL
ncbi:hypothetical protein HPB49_003231 [Dermacentor silvarum]|uniref:Uncharacterized protein n=1 Tax=Dermacentor silvarum TaxID=543639 RepID=A0ACB8C764_DERSI|nr:hypothetical protein HPB49_003231 [Dermacentor silvarum]